MWGHSNMGKIEFVGSMNNNLVNTHDVHIPPISNLITMTLYQYYRQPCDKKI